MKNIHHKYGIPREFITCTGGCGKIYNGMVCVICEECKKCCKCKKPKLIDATTVKEFIADQGESVPLTEILND